MLEVDSDTHVSCMLNGLTVHILVFLYYSGAELIALCFGGGSPDKDRV